MPENPPSRSLPERFAEISLILATDEPALQLPRGGQSSVADLLRDLLQPMIQRWLDDNLQALAERIIRAEVAEAVRRSTDDHPASFAETAVWSGTPPDNVL